MYTPSKSSNRYQIWSMEMFDKYSANRLKRKQWPFCRNQIAHSCNDCVQCTFSLANRSWRRKNVAAVLWRLEFVQFARTYVWYPFVDECASLNLAYPMPKRSFEKLYIFDQYLEHVQSWKLYKHEPFNNVTKHAHPTHWKKSKLRGIHRGLTEPTLEH